MMSGFLKFAFVLGMCAVAVTAKSVQIKDIERVEMTSEEKEFFLKMVSVAKKASMYGLSSDAILYKPAVSADGQCSVSGDVGTCTGSISVPVDLGFWSYTFDVNAELIVDYIPENYGVQITLKVNGDTIVNQEVSAVNPPYVCYGVATFVTACLKISDISISGNNFHACFGLVGRVAFIDVANLSLGCLDI
ncbi:uncharacterized protein LOC117305230 [Asterias rubens]|uniref:uncharacterized protein LOC117305230 n=1 Tax=Asterias rubens TaxID=7604 RepID=UPI00145573BC|nr:uncharacterized protein LOC117305230 [Asterias rubens]